MHDHFEELYADFREFYNLRLTDVLKFDGSLSVWEAALLAKKLPERSRTIAALQGGVEYQGWTLDRHLLASLLDAINSNTFAFVSANSKKKPKPPKPVQRPGDAERKQKEKENNPFALMVKKQMDALKSTDQKTKIVIPDD